MDRIERYLFSETEFSSLESDGPLSFPYANPAKSKHADKRKLRYVGKGWYHNGETGEEVERILRETAKKTKVKTNSSWIREKLAPYVEKAVYYLNKLFAKETGYISEYDTVELEEMKDDPYIRDRKGRIIGKIRGVYKTATKKIGLNRDLAEKEEAEGVYVLVHELGHQGKHEMGELGEYHEIFGPFAVPIAEAKNDVITDIVAPQVYSDRTIERYMRTPKNRLPTA